MLPGQPASLNKSQRQLLRLFAQLDDLRQQQLMDFAEFLLSRSAENLPGPKAEPQEPQIIPRPDQESVIGAIKRLSNSYSMLNRDDMLHETSELISVHVLKGVPADEVIDELEVLFVRHYEKYRDSKASGD